MKRKTVLMALVMLVLISVSFSGVERTPIGEIITGGQGEVFVNGVRVSWGSTVYGGSEIRTSTGAAFVRFTQGGGVMSINENSRVRISREEARIVAHVLQGSVTMRSDAATRVLALNRVIESDPANVYSVGVSEAEAIVKTFQKPVRVSIGDKVLTVLPEMVGSAARSLVGRDDWPRPEAAARQVVTDDLPLYVECDTVYNPWPFCFIIVTGRTFSFGTPTIGALLRAAASFGGFQVVGQSRSGGGGVYYVYVILNAAQCAAARAGGTVDVFAASGDRQATCQDLFP